MPCRTLVLVILARLFTASLASAADAPIPPKEAPGRMTLPAGFHVTLFAGEPDVVQPIAFTFDDRGRLWVVECLSYPKWTEAKEGTDRVVIFEDTDGDGRFDKRTIFYDKGANLSGIALGFGGVWLCSTPNLLFIPMGPGQDKPAGPPVVVLDGWNLREAQHNVFNDLTWGPDGWLYGCNGIQSKSHVGKPGTPAEQRVFLDCGVWRYHPTKAIFEVVARGTTNPWGLDFDDYGQAFITNCVIKHLWHVIPGARFQRMYGQDADPYTYGLLESCADHIHWGGGHWTDSRGGKGEHSAAGGGHAHVGAMVYLGDNWPAAYRNGLFTCNLHGNRVNHDTLSGSAKGF
jgi:putative membrane-bound dehydrogenase-like protein